MFFNDILIYSSTWKLHLKYVRQFLHFLQKNQFYVKLKKCVFSEQELEYLGHVVMLQGVKVD